MVMKLRMQRQYPATHTHMCRHTQHQAWLHMQDTMPTPPQLTLSQLPATISLDLLIHLGMEIRVALFVQRLLKRPAIPPATASFYLQEIEPQDSLCWFVCMRKCLTAVSSTSSLWIRRERAYLARWEPRTRNDYREGGGWR